MADKIVKIYGDARFIPRHDTLENWQTKNPVLLQAEPSYVIDGKDGEKIKFGDGVTPWDELPYLSSSINNGGDITVDQTYNPESENPQSGKAIATEIERVNNTFAPVIKNTASASAIEASASAIEAQGKTEDARAALEGYSEWVFDGGDASGSVGIELVVDKEMSDTSSNTVQNRVIKAYIDGKSEVDKELSKLKTDMVDYIVEQGEKDGGYYEKWLSGKAKYWGKKSYGDVPCGKSWHNWYETEALTLNLPEGLFIGDFPDDFDIRLLKGGAVGFTNLGAIAPTTTEIKFSFSRPTATTFYDCVVGYRVIGRWKE